MIFIRFTMSFANKVCHAEGSEASFCPTRQPLRSAQSLLYGLPTSSPEQGQNIVALALQKERRYTSEQKNKLYWLPGTSVPKIDNLVYHLTILLYSLSCDT